MEKSNWIPDELGRKEKGYILDHLTSSMMRAAYMVKIYKKEEVQLQRVLNEIKKIKTRGD